MTTQQRFYYLSCKGKDSCSMSRAALAVAHGTWLCQECLGPKPGVREVDAVIEEERPGSAPLTGVPECGLGIALKEFLFALGEEEVQRDLYLGRVFSEDKGLLEDWVSFNGKKKVIVRGSHHLSCRKCPECTRHVYFAMGKRYLYPEPPTGIAIFHADRYGLVVLDSLIQRVVLNRWKDLSCVQLHVLPAPLDGLGVLE